MLFQLGNKRFEGLYLPYYWSHSGSEANLAEYELINTKPRLQHTGVSLEEISLSFQLRLDFCSPDQEILAFEAWKDTGEILPLLIGNGNYIGDFVIKSVGKTIGQTMEDGTIVQAQISLSLLEYVSSDWEEQQRKEDKRNALAVDVEGNSPGKQKKTPEGDAHTALLNAQNEAWEAANAIEELYQAENPESKIEKVKRKSKEAQKGLSLAKDKIEAVQQQINNATGIINAIENAQEKFVEISFLMQSPLSLYNIGQSLLNIQNSIRGIDTTSTVFTKDIILRKL